MKVYSSRVDLDTGYLIENLEARVLETCAWANKYDRITLSIINLPNNLANIAIINHTAKYTKHFMGVPRNYVMADLMTGDADPDTIELLYD